ncbi:MAG TPA: type II secretion system protein [Methylomirabilota bacterium]|nr:type II secretion system protein [Methylomirabilota bacterium]
MTGEVRTMILNERGLTLAEILVAVAIIGLGLAGLAVVIPVSSYGVQEGSQLSTATFLAEQMIERARSASWTATPATDCLGISPGGASPTGPPVPTLVVDTSVSPPTATIAATCGGVGTTQFADEANVSGYTQYSRQVRVTQCSVVSCAGVAAGVPAQMMRKVGVTVTYRPLSASGGSATNKTVYLEWLVSQK